MKFICLDIDGVLLPRNTVFLAPQSQTCPFHPLDLQALTDAIQQNFPVLILSGGNSQAVRFHLKELGVHSIVQSCFNKFEALSDALLAFPTLTLADVLYVGDGLNDLECLQNVGFPACPADADASILAAVKFISSRPGGQGAVAEAFQWAFESSMEG